MGDIALRRFDLELVAGDEKPKYAGETEFGRDDDDERWTIWKYVYDAGSGKVLSIEELHGAWSERDSLDWTT